MNDIDSSTDESPLDALAEDFVVRYRNGERPGVTEYIERFPSLANEIRDLFPTLVKMEDARPDLERREDFSGIRGAAGGKKLERLGDYRILREVGRGGMGIVYEAEQESLGRHVALKVLPRHSLLDPRHLQRFEREARAAARLHHTNIVPVFGIGEQDGLHYYVMQFIQGLGLDAVLIELKRLRKAGRSEQKDLPPVDEIVATNHVRRSSHDDFSSVVTTEAILRDRSRGASDGTLDQEPLSPARVDLALDVRPIPDTSSSEVHLPGYEQGASLSGTGRKYWHGVARVGVQVADALAYAHSQGVLHRDIKPSNLLLDTQGTVWVTDFGLAKATDSDDLTHTGDIVGTLRYLAPERLHGQSDQRSDIYSLGVTLYELLTLRPPFEEQDRTALVRQVMQAEPVRLRALDVEIPLDLETIVLKAIAKDAGDRYSSPLELAEDLRRFVADRPIIARPPAIWERTWRLSRRNPLTVSLLGALLLVLLAGLIGVTVKWREAVVAREAERLARRDADNQAWSNQQGLRNLQRAHILLDQGRFQTDANRWDDADRTFTEAIRVRPDYGNAWDARGHLYARLGLFDLAAFDLNKAFELQESVFSWRWFAEALLRRHVGDEQGYRHVCTQMRSRFEGSNHHIIAIELIRTWALAPQSDADLTPLLQTGESVLTSHPDGDAWFRYVLGVAYYRLGRHEQAVLRLHESLTDDPPWPARGIAYPVLAMAHYRQGNIDQAKQAMRSANEAIDQWTQQVYAPREGNRWPIHQGAEGAWPIPLWDWIEFQLNYRDAKELIDGAPPAMDPRMLVVRARAFAALRRRDTADSEYGNALEVSPDDPLIRFEAHRNRGYLHANQKGWDDAATEFERAKELGPDDAHLWSFQANAYLAAGRHADYRRVCAGMLERFRKTEDPAIAHLVVLACVSLPDALPDMRELIPLARLAAPWHHGNVRVLGAALYRAGDHVAAANYLEESARFYHPRTWELCFLAMAYSRSGRPQQAHRCLVKAHDWIQEANRQVADDLTGVQRHFDTWEEHVQFPTLLHEAESLLNSNGDVHRPLDPALF